MNKCKGKHHEIKARIGLEAVTYMRNAGFIALGGRSYNHVLQWSQAQRLLKSCKGTIQVMHLLAEHMAFEMQDWVSL